MLAAGNFPQHRTRARTTTAPGARWSVWRRRWVSRLGKLSIDGTKVRAWCKAIYDRMPLGRIECCYARRMRPTRPRTRALARRGDELPGRERASGSGRRRRADSGGRRRAGSAAGQDRNPKGGPPQAGVWRPDEMAQSNFTPGKLDHEASDATTRRWRWTPAPVGGGDGSGERECQGESPCCSTRSGAGSRAAGDGAGRALQRGTNGPGAGR